MAKAKKNTGDQGKQEVLPPEFDPVVQEIDDELRHERMVAFWKRHGSVIVLAVVLVVVFVTANQGWHAWKQHRAEEATSDYMQVKTLHDQAYEEEALPLYAALARSSHPAFPALAGLQQADTYWAQGEDDEALKAYDAVLSNHSVDEALRQQVWLYKAWAVFSRDDDVSAMQQEVREMLSSGEAVYPGLMKEWLAVTYWKAGQADAAVAILSEITEQAGMPAGVQERAIQLLATLGVAHGANNAEGTDPDLLGEEAVEPEEDSADDVPEEAPLVLESEPVSENAQ